MYGWGGGGGDGGGGGGGGNSRVLAVALLVVAAAAVRSPTAVFVFFRAVVEAWIRGACGRNETVTVLTETVTMLTMHPRHQNWSHPIPPTE